MGVLSSSWRFFRTGARKLWNFEVQPEFCLDLAQAFHGALATLLLRMGRHGWQCWRGGLGWWA